MGSRKQLPMISTVRTYPDTPPHAFQPGVLWVCLEVSSGLATLSIPHRLAASMSWEFMRNVESWAELQTY